MARNKSNIKRGMDGSHGGRGRYEKTAVLKNDSKGQRRKDGKDIIRDELADSIVCATCYFFSMDGKDNTKGTCLFWIPLGEKKEDDTCKIWRRK